MIGGIRGIIALLEAIPMLRSLMVDAIRLLKEYEASRRKQDKLDRIDIAIDDVTRMRDTQERQRHQTDKQE